MRPIPLLALLLLVVAGAVYLLAPDAAPPIDAATEAQEEAEQERVAADLAGVEAPLEGRTAAAAEQPAPSPAEVEEPEPAVTDEPEPDEGPGDMSATDPIVVRVVDAQGAPVMDADVRIRGMRSVAHPGSAFGYRGTEPRGTTDFDGRVELEHWAWVTTDGRAQAVDLHVAHPDFVAFRDTSFPIGPGVHTAVLERGAIVSLTAWVDSPSNVVSNLQIRADWSSGVGQDDWTVEPDGRLSTSAFGAGAHALLLEHRSPEHGHRFSERVEFALEAEQYLELFVELEPASDFVGRIDPRVPRPIVDGIAVLSIHSLADGNSPTVAIERHVDIDEDGEFRVVGLPPGEGQVFALCGGWITTREDIGVKNGRTSGDWPRIALPRDAAFEVPMEQTGTLEVTVTTLDGAPLPDATVYISPNYYFHGVGSSIVPGREWTATTDGSGRAEIVDIPRSGAMFVQAAHADHQHQEAERLETPRVQIVSGELATIELVLEPKP